jgi:lambda family phage tail tape measure protein
MGGLAERKAQLNIEINASGVKPALDGVKSQAAEAAKQIREQGAAAGRGLGDGIGEGAESARRTVERETAKLLSSMRREVSSAQREIASIDASKGSSQYFDNLSYIRGADQRGLSAAASELSAYQSVLSVTQAREREFTAQKVFAQKAADAANLVKAGEYVNWWSQQMEKAEAQERQLATQNSFINSLREQAAVAGKTRAEILEMKAAQLGVADSAAPLIAQLRASEGAVHGLTAAGHSLRNAMRTVPMQFTDIVVSLQAGQSPFQVFLQQGGQLKDMFGGAGPAARAMADYVLGLITPTYTAAAAFGVLGVAMYQGRTMFDGLNRDLIMSGNSTAVFSDSYKNMANSVAMSTGEWRGTVVEAMSAIVKSNQVGAENIALVTQAAVELERYGGVAISESANMFAELGKKPVEASEKLNETYGYLTASVYRQIQALEEQGKRDEAAALAQKAFANAATERINQVKESLGPLQKWWIDVGEAARFAWGQMQRAMGWTAASKQEQLLNLDNQIAEIGKYYGTPGTSATLSALKQKRDALQAEVTANYQAEKAQRAKNEAEKASVDLLAKRTEFATKAEKKSRELAAARELYEKSGGRVTSSEYQDIVSGINNKYKESAGRHRMSEAEKLAHKQETAYDRLTTSIKKYRAELDAVIARESQASKYDKLAGGIAAEFDQNHINLKQKNSLLKELEKLRQNEIDANSRVAVKDFTTKMDEENQKLREKYTALGMVGIELDVYNMREARRMEAIQKLNQLQREGKTITGEAAQAIYAAADASARQSETMMRAANDMQRSWEFGWKKSFDSYVDNATNAAQQAQSVFSTATKGMEDALTKFAMTGKLDFNSLANSIIADLIRIQVRAMIVQALTGISGGWGGGSSSSAATGVKSIADSSAKVYHTGGIVGDSAASRAIDASVFAGAQRYHSGGWPGLARDEVPAILQTGEQVLSRAEVAASRASAGRSYPAMSAAGTVSMIVPPININVINESGQAVEAQGTARANNNGGIDIDVLVRNSIASDVAKNGPTAKLLQNTYGLRRQVS